MIHVCERGIIICSNKMGMMMNIVMIVAIRRLHHSGKKEREQRPGLDGIACLMLMLMLYIIFFFLRSNEINGNLEGPGTLGN